MTFKIILTVLFSLSGLMPLTTVDEPREPISAVSALLSLAISAVLIYGVWTWL